MSITTAIVDSREPQWVQLCTFGAPLVTVGMLEHGDLLATTDDNVMLAVERKTASDLLGSIKDGRLWPQLAGMRAQTPWAYLVITGTLSCDGDGYVATSRGVTGWNWASLQGALLKAQELGVFVVQCAEDAYEETVTTLSARSHEATAVIQPVKQPVPLSPGEEILASLPGIGVEKLQRLLEYVGRPCVALHYLTETDTGEDVPGIGPATKRRIREALGLKPNETLIMWDKSAETLDPLAEGEHLLASLPGIGRTIARQLTNYVGRPGRALALLTDLDAPERVPGINNTTKRRIRELLGLTNDEELSVVLSESGAIATRTTNDGAAAVAQKAS